MYQPAAQAEARAISRLLQKQAAPAPVLAAGQPAPPPAAAAPSSGQAAGEAALSPSQRAAADDLVRSIMLEEQRARTKELVDSAWQSLE